MELTVSLVLSGLSFFCSQCGLKFFVVLVSVLSFVVCLEILVLSLGLRQVLVSLTSLHVSALDAYVYTGSAVGSELSQCSVITSDDWSQSTDDDDFDDQPSPAELSSLFKVTYVI